MTKRLLSALSVLLLLLFGLPAPLARTREKQDNSHRSPRATVQTLLTAITLSRGAPQRIEEAVSCLDVGGLPANHQNTAGLLAAQLEGVLRARGVDTTLLPDESKGTDYVFPAEKRISLKRSPDGRWLFDRATVARIPELHAETRKALQDKNREAAALSVPPDHASPGATMRTLVEGYRRQDFQRILRCLDMSEVPSVARPEAGAQLANKLKQIILRHRLPILQEIPDSNYSDPYVVLSQPEGVVEVVRLVSGPRKGEWVLSRATVASIDKLYVVFEDKPYLEEVLALGLPNYLPTFWNEPELWLRSRLPPWLGASLLSTQRITLEVYELLGYLVVPLLAYGLHRLTIWLLAAGLHLCLVRRSWPLPHDVLVKRLRPMGRFVVVLFLRWALLALEPDAVLLIVFLTVLNPLLWILGMWAIFRVLDLVADLIEVHLTAENRRPEVAQMFWPVGSLVLKISLFVVTMFHLMSLFAWDVTAVLTGLGIGGLAFALGARDSLKNLFGSFTLIADRPFIVGESVKIGSHEVGVVEVVGLRSTRIRTADDTLLIVPNSSLTVMEITNYGRRRYRRYQTRIGVAYSASPEQLIAFRDGLKKVIQGQDCIRKNHFEVAVNDLAASAVEILVNIHFEVANRQEELAARDALILDILRLAATLNIELAYPTQTIHLVPSTDQAQPASLQGGLPDLSTRSA